MFCQGMRSLHSAQDQTVKLKKDIENQLNAVVKLQSTWRGTLVRRELYWHLYLCYEKKFDPTDRRLGSARTW